MVEQGSDMMEQDLDMVEQCSHTVEQDSGTLKQNMWTVGDTDTRALLLLASPIQGWHLREDKEFVGLLTKVKAGIDTIQAILNDFSLHHELFLYIWVVVGILAVVIPGARGHRVSVGNFWAAGLKIGALD